MKRLTTNDENHILASLNLFYCKDNEVWIRGGGPEPDYADCTLVDWIVSAAEKHLLDIFSRDAEDLGEEMYDSMQFGSDTIEGIVALLHAAAIQAAEMRGRLAAIEDILGDEYDLEDLKKAMWCMQTVKMAFADDTSTIERLRELAQADRLIGSNVYEPNKRGFISVYEIISVHISKCSILVGWNLIDGVYSNLNGFEISALGKTVFLTREEAEQALRREQE